MTIRLEKVTKLFPGVAKPAVDALDLTIESGQVCVLIGPSGCGKTTTMRMVNRLIEPTSGQIFVGDRDVTKADPVELRRHIGYVIQQIGLFPCPGCSAGRPRASRRASRRCWSLSGSIRRSSSGAIRAISRAGSASASAWRARSRPIHR